MIYAVGIIYTILFVYYSKFQFADLRQEKKKKWKVFGFGMRALQFLGCYLMQKYPSSWQDYLLCGSFCILLWEWGINVIALNAPSILYVGTTGKLDIFFGKYKWMTMVILLIASIILKVIT